MEGGIWEMGIGRQKIGVGGGEIGSRERKQDGTVECRPVVCLPAI